MADISKIKLPSGNTYDIVDKKSGYKVVSINRKVDSGVNIADITIGDTTTQLYAPQGGGAGTITKVKTTAGAHTAIDVSSGAAEFNVPTKTSHLTNDSGFVTTDEKVKTNSISNDTVYYPIVGSATSSATTKYYDASGLHYIYISSSKTAALMIGNETAISSNGKKGILRLGGSTQFKGVIDPGAPTADRTYTLPDASGTIALTSDTTKVQIVRW